MKNEFPSFIDFIEDNFKKCPWTGSRKIEDFKKEVIHEYCLDACSGKCCDFWYKKKTTTKKSEGLQLDVENEQLREIIESQIRSSWLKRELLRTKLRVGPKKRELV